MFADWTDIVLLAITIASVGGFLYLKFTKGDEAANAFIGKLDAYKSDARDVVIAVEQLWQTGQIPEESDGTKNARFLKAAELLRGIHPGISDEILETSIEVAVAWVKQFYSPTQAADEPDVVEERAVRFVTEGDLTGGGDLHGG